MSLIEELRNHSTLRAEQVDNLIASALIDYHKNNETELTSEELYLTLNNIATESRPIYISRDLYNYVENYYNSSKNPPQQEVLAEAEAPKAPQAKAEPKEAPAQQEAPVKKAKRPAKTKESKRKTNYHYSFSGADCDVYAYRNADEFTHLKTIATLSTSIYESKSPVRVLGSAGPVGYTGSIRTIAGSMVFVLTEDHPLRELLETGVEDKDETFRYFDDTNENNAMLSGMAAPFNILVIYKNEVGAQLMYRLEDVEIISEGIVSSVNDMITEMVFQFVALDMQQISKE